MIELISTKRCITCNICVQVCPTNVFDAVLDQPPVIARQEDCQTCFMCEAYCPADALYVAPESHTKVEVDEDELIDRGIMGEYRRTLGWGYGRQNNSDQDTAHKLSQLTRPYAAN
ncbi:MAG: ferredoxin family protein [Leptolyngbya sp. UWPOB_LEPTO1]|uniref:4Fe-4S dicluster domain-containing protein n=1 Tax=Leptolyngbya sp. UWPOB_LEPTO1 TaxID=2815653 RepID=UPI001AD2E685|nr:ferredoxin family protein [Leptolyngbya sp. UWPOB_LEPTO1]MBN8562984.1 ferredoxin family protein [Leptolyngbya sp. UWPOB_LEPTO1]